MSSTVLGARYINSKPPGTHSLPSKPSTKTDKYTNTGVTDSDILVNIYQFAQGMVRVGIGRVLFVAFAHFCGVNTVWPFSSYQSHFTDHRVW